MRWAPAWVAAALFALTGLAILALALRPAIEIYDSYLLVGGRAIQWSEIRRIDQSGWNAPLVVYLTLADTRRFVILHPGDLDSSTSLLRHLRRNSKEALLDGIPYRQFWGESIPAPKSTAAAAVAQIAAPETPKQLPPGRYPLLRPEDEDEVERMFHQLKSAGRIERSDEN